MKRMAQNREQGGVGCLESAARQNTDDGVVVGHNGKTKRSKT